MTCQCKPIPGLFGSQSEVKHYVIHQECLGCGYVFSEIERDEAAYKVRNFLNRVKCPVCGADAQQICAAVEVGPDRFESWDGTYTMEVADEAEVEKLAQAIRSCAGSA